MLNDRPNRTNTRSPINFTDRPVWSRGGDWGHLTTNSVWGFLRQVSFTNPRIQSSVKTIYLSEYTNGDFIVTLGIRPEHFESFSDRLVVDANIPRPTGSDRIAHHVSVRAHGSESSILSSFLMKACAIDPDLESVCDEIIRIINDATRHSRVSMHAQNLSESRGAIQINFRSARAFRTRNASSALMQITGDLNDERAIDLPVATTRPLALIHRIEGILSSENPWTRHGNLNTFLAIDSENRSLEVVYENLFGGRRILKIELTRSPNSSDIIIGIKTRPGRRLELEASINFNGLNLQFENNVLDAWTYIKAAQAHYNDMIELLKRLSISDPEVAHILPEISEGIRSVTVENPPVSVNSWVREGDFAVELPSNGSFIYNRSALYSNTAENRLIRRVFIIQSRGNDRKIEISITSSSNRFQELMGAVNNVLEGGHQLFVSIYSDFNEVRVNAAPAFFEHLVDFMLSLAMRATQLAHIHDEIVQGIRFAGQATPGYTSNPPRADTALQRAEAQSLEGHYSHTGATYRLSRTTAPAIPDVGANAKALENINVDVPDHLCCALSLQIMTDPVRFEGLANQDCFEDAWIMEYLRENKKHPITQEPVSEKMLVSVLDLKRECDTFTKEGVKDHAVKNMRVTQ